MSYEEAAAIPVNYVTAYHMLFCFGGLRSGMSVLIHMAAGGVGTAAIQLCRTVANITIFGTASASKHEMLKKLGVDHLIDYRTQDYAAEIRKISPQGVDIVLDPLNGADAVKGFELLKPLGKIIHFGAANAVSGQSKSYWNMFKTYLGMKSYSPLSLMTQNRSVCGYHMGKLDPELIQSAMEELTNIYKQGKIKPQIDSSWSYEDVSKAMARMHDRLNIGKVLLKPHMSTAASTEGEAGKK
jgi:NADPH:quinone reductase-like Zn-dependent oxidoreductase